MLKILLLFILLCIVYSDFRFREFYAILIPLVFCAVFLYSASSVGWMETVQNTGFNIAFLIIQLSVLFGYLLIRNGSVKGIIDKKLGAGDFYFWLAVTPLLTLIDFVTFFISSLCVALLLHFVFRKYPFYGNSTKIPLAGIQAGYLIIFYLDIVNDIKMIF